MFVLSNMFYLVIHICRVLLRSLAGTWKIFCIYENLVRKTIGNCANTNQVKKLLVRLNSLGIKEDVLSVCRMAPKDSSLLDCVQVSLVVNQYFLFSKIRQISDDLQIGQTHNGVFLAENFEDNFAEICLRKEMIQKINVLQGEL